MLKVSNCPNCNNEPVLLTNPHTAFFYRDNKPYKFHCHCGIESKSATTISGAAADWNSKVKEIMKRWQ